MIRILNLNDFIKFQYDQTIIFYEFIKSIQINDENIDVIDLLLKCSLTTFIDHHIWNN